MLERKLIWLPIAVGALLLSAIWLVKGEYIRSMDCFAVGVLTWHIADLLAKIARYERWLAEDEDERGWIAK